jgi:hypothetical protein
MIEELRARHARAPSSGYALRAVAPMERGRVCARPR